MKQQDFYNTLTKENRVLDSYVQLSFEHNKNSIYTSERGYDNKNKGITATNIALFPSYLHPTFNNSSHFNIIKIPQKKITGYAILIKNHATIDELLKAEYKKSFRANILRFVNRFDVCFNANYKMFYGDVTKEDYNFLMEALHNMLIERFNQRNETNKVLLNWGKYLESTYNLIKEKKASLFVIYHNTTPVQISINHHFDKILFVSVPSFDTSYAKFALGNISLYKILEWAVTHHYEIMDMAYGELEYKRRWSTLIYDFDHHVIFPKKVSFEYLKALVAIKKLKFKNYLKSKNADTLFENIKKKLRKNSMYEKSLDYQLEDTADLATHEFPIINEETPVFNTIKIAVHDFLYSKKEHIDDLKIFELTKSKTYHLQGKSASQKLNLLE